MMFLFFQVLLLCLNWKKIHKRDPQISMLCIWIPHTKKKSHPDPGLFAECDIFYKYLLLLISNMKIKVELFEVKVPPPLGR